MDGLDEAYVRRAFLRSKHGRPPSARVRARAEATGWAPEPDALWIELPPPACEGDVFTEMCPFCLLACVELRRDDGVWLGRHDRCGTILHAEAR